MLVKGSQVFCKPISVCPALDYLFVTMVTCPIPPTMPLANTGQISCDREKSQKTIHKDGNIMIHGSCSWKSLIFDIFPCHRQLLMIRCSDIITWWNFSKILARDTLQWCYKEHDGVLNHQPHNCFLNRLFSHRSKKTSKLRVTGLYSGEFTGEFPTQRASNAENFSSWPHWLPVASWGVCCEYRAGSRFAPSQWETLLCNDVSDWLGTSLESAL